MKYVSVDEFGRHVMEYVESGEGVTLERDGIPVGYYSPATPAQVRAAELLRQYPSKKGTPEAKEAVDRLGRTVQRILDETGYTEEQLASLFDLSVPIEEALNRLPAPRSIREREESSADSHAVG